jgi:2',3'-cyclic-nucleotide 2'-phosphodiesterase (5'-nucleotidase family)
VKIPKKHKEIYKAKSDIILKTMSMLKYLAINVGEYDLGFGISYLKNKQKELNLPFISANLVDQTGSRYFLPAKLVEIQGIKLGIIGIIKSRIKKKKIPGGMSLNVLSPVKIVKSEAIKLREKGADVIIVLTDMGEIKSRMLTKKELPIDVIISSCRRNRISLPAIQNGKIILHLNRYGENVGYLRIKKLNKNEMKTKVMTGGSKAVFRGFLYKNTVVPLGHLVKDDAPIAEMVNAFAKKYPYAR